MGCAGSKPKIPNGVRGKTSSGAWRNSDLFSGPHLAEEHESRHSVSMTVNSIARTPKSASRNLRRSSATRTSGKPSTYTSPLSQAETRNSHASSRNDNDTSSSTDPDANMVMLRPGTYWLSSEQPMTRLKIGSMAEGKVRVEVIDEVMEGDEARTRVKHEQQ